MPVSNTVHLFRVTFSGGDGQRTSEERRAKTPLEQVASFLIIRKDILSDDAIKQLSIPTCTTIR